MQNYLKRHLIISAILSLVIVFVVGGAKYYYDGYLQNFTEYLTYFFASFGLCVVANVLALIFFPEWVVTDEDVEDVGDDEGNYVEVYFYEGFSCGVARVVKIYGDQTKKNGLEREFNFINEDGDFIFDQWFLTAEPFKDDRTIVMDKNFKFNVGTPEGKLLSDRGFSMMSSEWSDGKVKVGDGEGNVNFLRIEDGSLVWANWRQEHVNYNTEE